MSAQTRTETVFDAAETLAANIDRYTAYDVGPHMTCNELDALARLLYVLGETGTAAAMIQSHIDNEDENEDTDLHYGLTDAGEYLKGWTA